MTRYLLPTMLFKQRQGIQCDIYYYQFRLVSVVPISDSILTGYPICQLRALQIEKNTSSALLARQQFVNECRIKFFLLFYCRLGCWAQQLGIKMVSPQKSTKLYFALGAENSKKSKFIFANSNEYNNYYIYILNYIIIVVVLPTHYLSTFTKSQPIRSSIFVNIPVCHAGDLSSILGREVFYIKHQFIVFIQLFSFNQNYKFSIFILNVSFLCQKQGLYNQQLLEVDLLLRLFVEQSYRFGIQLRSQSRVVVNKSYEIIIKYIIKTQMQPKYKQEILKLLDLDLMITDYLNEPKLNRKTPATNNRDKINKQKQLNQKLLTVDVPSNIRNKRTYSANNIGKKTLEVSHTQRNEQMIKNSSGTINRLNKSTNIFVKPHFSNNQRDRSSHSIKKIRKPVEHKFNELNQSNNFQQITAKANQLQGQSTNFNVHQPKNELFQLNQKVAKPLLTNKQRIKLRLPNSKFILQQNNQKSGSILKGRYKIQKLIGRGLSGKVYKAKDVLSERNVAIKIIDPQNIQYQFIKELNHPNMISYYNSFVENNKRYIVLEYLPHSLGQVVRKRKINEEQLKKIFKSISSGLMYLHSLSYAHRDIKLDNIVSNDDFSVVKFIDFGLCVDTSSVDLKQKMRFCGTTSYMAPQVISGKCSEPKKADIWSLGVALYILSVGRNPFTGRQQFQIFNKIKSNKTLFPNQMSQQLKQLISSMLSKNPQNRPSIFEVINSNWLAS